MLAPAPSARHTFVVVPLLQRTPSLALCNMYEYQCVAAIRSDEPVPRLTRSASGGPIIAPLTRVSFRRSFTLLVLFCLPRWNGKTELYYGSSVARERARRGLALLDSVPVPYVRNRATAAAAPAAAAAGAALCLPYRLLPCVLLCTYGMFHSLSCVTLSQNGHIQFFLLSTSLINLRKGVVIFRFFHKERERICQFSWTQEEIHARIQH